MTAEKRYLAEVKRALVCPRRDRKSLLGRAEELLADFAAENPDADDAAIRRSFGPPEEFARELMSTLTPGAVDATRRKRRRLRLGLAAAALLLPLLLSLFWALKYQSSVEEGDDFYVIQEEAIKITNEEAREIFNSAPKSAQSHLEGYDDFP